MPYGDPQLNNNYVQTLQAPFQQAYLCTDCGQYACGPHACYGSRYTQTVIYQTATATPMPDPTQQAILNELKLMREAFEALMDQTTNLCKALESLTDLTVNDHEEVRRCDDGGSGDPAVDLARGLEGCTLRDVTEVAKRLGL